MNRWKNPTTIIALLALFVALGGGAALASKAINGKSIKNGSISLSKLSPKAVKALRGQKGPKGDSGPQGPPGTGARGPTGVQGPRGNVGVTGARGPVGGVGPTGIQGPRGNEGVTGADGVQGNPGIIPIYNIGGTLQSSQHAVAGTFTMPNSNGPSTVTLTNSAVFTSASSYFCTIADTTTTSAQAKLVKTNGAAFTLATVGATAKNDAIDFICIGS